MNTDAPATVDPDQLCVCGATDAEHHELADGRLECPDDDELEDIRG